MKNPTIETVSLPVKEGEKNGEVSLDPLAENFDFDHWAKIVKRQMITSLNNPFSVYLSKNHLMN
jgi:hypothetical protein